MATANHTSLCSNQSPQDSAVTLVPTTPWLAAALTVHVSCVMGWWRDESSTRGREAKERKTPQGHVANHSAGFCTQLRTGQAAEQRIECCDVQHTRGTEHT
ncbi:uncharacterized [Tachysurus ichikawai]